MLVVVMIFMFSNGFAIMFQQLMASRSDALFQDAKSKLQEIRAQHSKRLHARTSTGGEQNLSKKRKTKNNKSNDGHAWV